MRILSHLDFGDAYCEWMRDPIVCRYLESRFQEATNESIASFIKQANDAADTLLMGIFIRDSGKHIGNIKLGPINFRHRRAEIGLLLGDRNEWNKGYASEAIAAVCELAFNQLGIEKMVAGCYEENQASLGAFAKAGFSREAFLPDYWELDGKRQAQIFLGCTRSSMKGIPNGCQLISFEAVASITFIGGGSLMAECIKRARSAGYKVEAILAPRHASELMHDGRTLQQALQEDGSVAHVVEDINVWADWGQVSCRGKQAVALCFGPTWIFSESVIRSFEYGMFNFNGIPIPEYLGGAHYTWQILNGNRQGGCFLQEITDHVDHGDVVRYEYFQLPAGVRTPDDYFRENNVAGIRFIDEALSDMRDGVPFVKQPYEHFNIDRLYFPRLYTKENAYIDWRWTGTQIERFCNAFDLPYIGAATFWRGQEIRVRTVRFEARGTGFHPYVSGLVVRCCQGCVWLAVEDGELELGEVSLSTGESALASLREGDRLLTPESYLHNSRAYSPKFGSQGMSNNNSEQGQG
jgi:RimJ/RimL family protein N-acetyltransferase/methionyl-tRNA formyltransferase